MLVGLGRRFDSVSRGGSQLKTVILCALIGGAASLAGPVAAASSYQDWWWDAAKSGMGFNVGQQDDTVVVAWYHFADDGRPTYLMLAGRLVNGRLSGDLVRPSGPPPGPGFDPAAVARTVVGTATLSFAGLDNANFVYDYEGRTGSIALNRYTYRHIPLHGSWQYAATASTTNCADSRNNGTATGSGWASVTSTGGAGYRMTLYEDAGGSCSYTLNLPQAGGLVSGTGTFTCTSGYSGTLTVDRLRVLDDFLSVDYVAQGTTGEVCRESGRLGAVRR